MKNYTNIDTLWGEVVSDLLAVPTRGSARGDMREIIGWSARLVGQGQSTFLCNPRRALDPAYAAAETLWYLGRGGDVEMMKAYAAQYANYAEDDGTVHGAYGKRLATNLANTTEAWNLDELDVAVKTLKKSPETRQCVVSLWHPEDLLYAHDGATKDLPCTLAWQFFVRDGSVDMVAYMRSNDAWLGLPYDIFAFTCVQRLVANELGLGVGTYTHHVGSMHLYEKHVTQAEEAVLGYYPAYCRFHYWMRPSTMEQVPKACDVEVRIRKERTGPTNVEYLGEMLRDLVLACRTKWSRDGVLPASPALRQGLENHDAHIRRRGLSRKDDPGTKAS